MKGATTFTLPPVNLNLLNGHIFIDNIHRFHICFHVNHFTRAHIRFREFNIKICTSAKTSKRSREGYLSGKALPFEENAEHRKRPQIWWEKFHLTQIQSRKEGAVKNKYKLYGRQIAKINTNHKWEHVLS